MAKVNMPDVIVLLPGITGSQLRKDGKVVWGFSGGTLAKTLLTRGGHMRRALMLEEEPVEEDDLSDRVVADRLIPDLHLLPGFWDRRARRTALLTKQYFCGERLSFQRGSGWLYWRSMIR